MKNIFKKKLFAVYIGASLSWVVCSVEGKQLFFLFLWSSTDSDIF